MGIFSDAKGQSVVVSHRISNSSELSCMLLLPASMKKSDQEQLRKSGNIVFRNMSVFFFDAKGQLTPQSVVKSHRFSNSYELSCMLLLPESMKAIG